jgi:hypothetical protein
LPDRNNVNVNLGGVVTTTRLDHPREQGEDTMGLAFGVWLAVLGILGASNLIIARKPDAKELIAKLAPYQGWIGAGAAISGLYYLIMGVLNIAMLGQGFAFLIAWITWMAVAFILFSLGLLLGVGTLKTFIKQPQAVAKMDQTIAKLAPYQGTLGLIAIGLGVWSVVSTFIF